MHDAIVLRACGLAAARLLCAARGPLRWPRRRRRRPATPPTAAEAKKFADDAEQQLLKLWIDQSRADWVKSTYITDDTEILAAQADEQGDRRRASTYAKQATRFDGLKLDAGDRAQAQAAEALADARRARRSDGERGADAHRRRRWRAPTARASTARAARTSCLDLEEHHARSWPTAATRRSCSTPGRAGTRSRRRSRKDFVRYVELANKGARELGFKDTGAMWRSKYDMPPDEFAKPSSTGSGSRSSRSTSRCTPTCAGSCARSTATPCPPPAPIPAHLLGNMWAQDWDNIYPLVAPAGRRPRLRPDRRSSRRARPTRCRWSSTARASSPRSASTPLPEDVLGALAVRQAEGPRGRLPRQRLGHRLRRRPAHQDVHRDHRRGLLTDPPRARPQLLPARLQQAAARSSATAPTTASTRRSATRSRSRSRRSTW